MASIADLERENKLLRMKLATALKATDAFVALADQAQKASGELKQIRSDVQALNINKGQG